MTIKNEIEDFDFNQDIENNNNQLKVLDGYATKKN